MNLAKRSNARSPRRNSFARDERRSRADEATNEARFAMELARPPNAAGVESAMRFAAAGLLSFALAACEQAPAPDAVTVPSEPAHAALAGDYKPASNTARAITGPMVVERAGISFGNGVILYTRTLNPRRGGDLIAKNGDSFAAAVLGPGTLNIELRRVTEQMVPEGAIGLCGAEAPQYVALAHDQRATTVTLLVFAGEEPPGPQALSSRVCARFGYAAPEGARTREGLVL